MPTLTTPSNRTVTAMLAAVLVVSTLVGAGGLTREATPADPRLALPPLQAPGEWFDSQRSIDGAPIDYAGAVAQAAAQRADAVGGEWTNLGPTNIGGRVNDVVTDADDPSIVYAATASGGVWRGTDHGKSWTPVWPADSTQAIGSLARNGDVLLAGTGEANPGGGSIVYGGTGVYASSDDGATWDLIGLNQSGAVGRIVEHGDGFLIAATGNLFVQGGHRGLYFWEPGMSTPELLMQSVNPRTGAVDVAVDPSDPDHILVAMWDHFRTPDARYYSGEGSGVYRSRDGGKTWALVPEITAEELTGEPAEDGRMAVAFAPSNPDRVYAEVANVASGRHGAFFVSDDGGETWEHRSNSTLSSTHSSFGWWFGRIYVDPADADRVFVMGVSLTESTDGGRTFRNVNNTLVGLAPGADRVSPHADQHSMFFETREEGLVYLGNDGGVYASTDDGQTWTSSLEQGWTQHYSVDVADVGSGDQVVTGLQDNGCHATYTASTGGDWVMNGLCGDGLESIFMPGNPTVSWSCSQYGGCNRNVAGVPDLGLTFPNAQRYGWMADIEYAPYDDMTLYTAGERVFRSTDGGTEWEEFTGDLSSDPEQIDPNPGYRLRGVVTSIAPGHEGEWVWVGTDEGRLWKVSAADGTDATLIDSETLPNAWITSVATDPADDDIAYVTYSGFRSGRSSVHVFRTADGGETWTDLSGDLPNAPVNDIILADDLLVVATDVGVFVADRATAVQEGVDWDVLGTNLPTVPVIQVDYEFGQITAATFGHGIQRIDIDPTLPVVPGIG